MPIKISDSSSENRRLATVCFIKHSKAPHMPTQFYIKRGEKVRGPISEQQLKKLMADGKLKSSDFISTHSTC